MDPRQYELLYKAREFRTNMSRPGDSFVICQKTRFHTDRKGKGLFSQSKAYVYLVFKCISKCLNVPNALHIVQTLNSLRWAQEVAPFRAVPHSTPPFMALKPRLTTFHEALRKVAGGGGGGRSELSNQASPPPYMTAQLQAQGEHLDTTQRLLLPYQFNPT